MTIHVKAGKVRLHLWFPTSIFKSRFAYKIAKRAIEDCVKKQSEQSKESTERVSLPAENQVEAIACEPSESETSQDKVANFTRAQMVEVYNVIKRYVKANGHFNLVEVDSHAGEKVRIRV